MSVGEDLTEYGERHAGTPDPFAGRTHRAMTQAEVEERLALNAANNSTALAARSRAGQAALENGARGQEQTDEARAMLERRHSVQ